MFFAGRGNKKGNCFRKENPPHEVCGGQKGQGQKPLRGYGGRAPMVFLCLLQAGKKVGRFREENPPHGKCGG